MFIIKRSHFPFIAVNWFFPHYFKEWIWKKKNSRGAIFSPSLSLSVFFLYIQFNQLYMKFIVKRVLMTFLLLLYKWKIASVYHTNTEQNNRKREKGKEKHNNRHMISMLAFLRQDASRHLLLKQLYIYVCVCVWTFPHIHIIYLMPCSRVLPSLSIAYRLSSAHSGKKRVMNSSRCEWMLYVK